MASLDGLQIIGVFGNTEPALGFEKCPIMSNISVLLLAVLEDNVEPVNSMSSSSSDIVLL